MSTTLSKTIFPFPRGSEWRKWDLHIHTPGTAKNDQFPKENAWEVYLSELEKSDIVAFGITDYWSMDNYYKVREAQQSGRLGGKFIIPNVELRITPVTDSNTPINLHILFDPALAKEVIERDFFQKCEFLYNSVKYTATRSQLISLGKQFKNNSNLDDDAAWKSGIAQFVVSYDKVFECLNASSLRGHYLLGVSNSNQDGNSGIRSCSLEQTRKEIYRHCHFIFSSNQQDVNFFLGKGAASLDELIREYGGIKPCVRGCDAHSLKEVATRFTWIKADPTFQGLRQIVFEPEGRVRISDSRPDQKPSYCIIDSIDLSDPTGIWKQQIPLNQNLTTIIGGRASGKTSLLDVIATKCNGQNGSPEAAARSFTQSLAPNVSIRWNNNHIPDNNGAQNLIEYFPQNYIVEIAEEPERLNEILVNILEDFGKRSVLKQISDLKQNHTQTSSIICNRLSSLLAQWSQLMNNPDGIANEDAIKHEIEELSGQATEVARKLKTSSEQLQFFQQTNDELTKKQNNLGELQQTINILSELQRQSVVLINEPVQINGLPIEIQKELRKTLQNSKEEVNRAWVNAILKIAAVIQHRIQLLSNEIAKIQDSETYRQLTQFQDTNTQYAGILERIKAEKQKLSISVQVTKTIHNVEVEIDRLVSELSQGPLQYGKELDRLGKLLTIEKDGLSIVAKRTLREKDIVAFLEPRLTKRSAEQKALVEKYSKGYDSCTPEDITRFIQDVFAGDIELNQGNTPQSLLQEYLSQNWEDLQFDVTYQNDSFKEMSPGKKSFVVLKLMLDFSKNQQPVLIDQPEDNLDNRAIYKELVAYLRNKKTTRQIIVVSHNANIVVGADAEEVIVANQNGSDAKNPGGRKFYYVSGSLENSRAKDINESCVLLSQGIQEHVCEILEGGKAAFITRERKYNLDQ